MVYSSFEGVYSNHRIVTAKICLRLYRYKTQTIKAPQYNWSALTSDVRNHYTVTVRNKFDSLQETSERLTLNDEYENNVTAPIEIAAECIPAKPKVKCRIP